MSTPLLHAYLCKLLHPFLIIIIFLSLNFSLRFWIPLFVQDIPENYQTTSNIHWVLLSITGPIQFY